MEILIAAGIFAFIILLVLFFRSIPRIRLFITRIRYGKFSYRYSEKYKKYFMGNPFPHCIKDELIVRLIAFAEKLKNSVTFKTEEVISFGDVPFYTNYKDLIVKKGNPYCFNASLLPSPKKEVKIVGFLEKLFDMEIKAHYYFIDGIFFMGEYVFKTTREEEIKKIAMALTRKYSGEEKSNTDNFYIEDINNNMIHFGNTGFGLIIKYLCKEDTRINELLNEYLNSINKQKKQLGRLSEQIFDIL